jgi:hypothetical protein
MFQCGIRKNPFLTEVSCLIQGIDNYVQVNTYWRYIVRIMASNICFLTSQGLVGVGMNYRALTTIIII